jgi:ADP-ribosylglycohydrolase
MGKPVSEGFLREELTALAEEGFDTTAPLARLASIAGAETEEAAQIRREIVKTLGSLPKRDNFTYEEPSSLAEIRPARPNGPRKLAGRISKAQLKDATLGAWLGRSAGCLLGKPCEGWSREKIEEVLRALGEWPLAEYWPIPPKELPNIPYHGEADPSLRQNITHMTRDDDMDYPIIGLQILESDGPGFETAAVGNKWLSRLPYHLVYTAELEAYRNLVNGLQPPATATHHNPYREWIGAQIRADIWGWACPGQPELAAELAFRDAALSHTKNGIYGEMFFAALMAAAFVERDLHKLIEIGLSEIPQNCRLREAVLDTVDWCAKDVGWEATWDRINEKYGHYHMVHTINNAAVVLMGLLHSHEDYEQAIAISVMGGWDTDCNGATAGSVMGIILGAAGLPAKWIAPLRDRIDSIVIGDTQNRISGLVKRTLKVQQTVAKWQKSK